MEQGETILTKNLYDSLNQFINSRNYSNIAVLVDENTLLHCYPHLKNSLPDHHLIEIKSGENEKNLATCTKIWSFLTELKFDRRSLFINLGGGVIGDMGGFCAASYKRGIDFINLPTTLLAQVDASIGGKLGIDFQQFKNHIGLFKSPQKVFIYEKFLETLPYKELRSGFAEVIKHHLIRDEKQWHELIKTDLQSQPWSDVIAHSIDIKKQIVKEDPEESGVRKILNYGHTVGHAVESFFLNIPGKRLLHGEAIAVGMIVENFISEKLTGLDSQQREAINQYIFSLYQPEVIDTQLFEEIGTLALQDKKNTGSQISCTLIRNIGEAVFDIRITGKDITEALDKYNSFILAQPDFAR